MRKVEFLKPVGKQFVEESVFDIYVRRSFKIQIFGNKQVDTFLMSMIWILLLYGF